MVATSSPYPTNGPYGLLGVCVAGLLPILLPLAVSTVGTAVQVSLVLAAYNASGLTSPVWGALADRLRIHRWLLAGGLGMAALALVLFSVSRNFWLLVLSAFLVNTGATSAGTVANLFVVERHPKREWDDRIGWLQTCYGCGQVLGLIVAGIVGQSALQVGLLVGAGCCAVGPVVGWLTTRTPATQPRQRPAIVPHRVIARLL